MVSFQGEYSSERVTIEQTNDQDVATALAYLAGFRRGTAIKSMTPGPIGTSRSIIVYHKETIAKSPRMFLETQNPDIIVSRFLGDEYLIEFNPERINSSLIGDLEEEIRKAYFRQ